MFNTSSQPKYRPSMSFNEILMLKKECAEDAKRNISFYKNYNGGVVYKEKEAK